MLEQRPEQRLPDGSRAGFFVGDGTGVGKARAGRHHRGQLESEAQRAIWLSVNNDLLESARRDLTDLELASIPLSRINDYPPAGEIALPRGVIFSSYSSLIAASQDGREANRPNPTLAWQRWHSGSLTKPTKPRMPSQVDAANPHSPDKRSLTYKTRSAMQTIAWSIPQPPEQRTFATWPIWTRLGLGESALHSPAAFKSSCRRLNPAEWAPWKWSAAI